MTLNATVMPNVAPLGRTVSRIAMGLMESVFGEDPECFDLEARQLLYRNGPKHDDVYRAQLICSPIVLWDGMPARFACLARVSMCCLRITGFVV